MIATRLGNRGFGRVAADTLIALAFFAFVVGATSWADRSAAESPRPNDLLSMSSRANEPVGRMMKDLPTAAGQLTMVAIPNTSAQEDTVFRRTPYSSALIVLAAVFSLLAAGNMALFRHLRRVAAPLRRGQPLDPAERGWT